MGVADSIQNERNGLRNDTQEWFQEGATGIASKMASRTTLKNGLKNDPQE